MKLSKWKQNTRSTWVEIGEMFNIDKSTAWKYARDGADISGKAGERVLVKQSVLAKEVAA